MKTEPLPRISAQDAEGEPTNGRIFQETKPVQLADVADKLRKPFSVKLIEFKPGAVTKDRQRALALAYVDPRAYQTRLDRVCGIEGWSVDYVPLSERAILCRLTILGVTKADVGESDTNDPNAATGAAMQAFKRACACFGLGRYLYALPQTWAAYDDTKKTFVDPEGIARLVYDSLSIEE